MTKHTVHYIFLSFLLLGMATGCKEEPKTPEETIITTFYLIRHAEKDRTDPSNSDPELNQDGLDRALKWAEVFDPIALDAIYATNYQRTTMTAAPASIKKDIEIEYYDPNSVDVGYFKQTHKGHNVLIVGHSNSTPDLVNKLLEEEKYEAMDDLDNSTLFIVRFINDTKTDLQLKMD